MATKRVHKNSFMYPDSLAKTAGSRTTRYRLLKKRRSSTVRNSASLREDEVLEASAVSNNGVGDDEETIAMCSEVGVIDSEVDCPPLTELDILSDFFCDELLLDERDTGRCTDNEDEDKSCSASEILSTNYGAALYKEQPLYPGCPLTPSSSSLLMMMFKMHHNLTEAAMTHLLQLV